MVSRGIIAVARAVDRDFQLYGRTKDAAALDYLKAEGLLTSRRCNKHDREENTDLESGDTIYEWTAEGRRALAVELPSPKLFPTLDGFQRRAEAWLLECFDMTIATTAKERAQRFIEEALELVQARGMTRQDVELMLDYVYSRPEGETAQEVGGVMVTLAALCWQANVSLQDAALEEMTRIEQPEVMEKIRAKQASKSAILGISAAGERL